MVPDLLQSSMASNDALDSDPNGPDKDTSAYLRRLRDNRYQYLGRHALYVLYDVISNRIIQYATLWRYEAMHYNFLLAKGQPQLIWILNAAMKHV